MAANSRDSAAWRTSNTARGIGRRFEFIPRFDRLADVRCRDMHQRFEISESGITHRPKGADVR